MKLSSRGVRLLVAVIAAGTVARIVVAFATYGVLYDVDSAQIVADALRTPGEGPYPTDRWPYPPGFFPFIWLADAIARGTGLPFHGLLQLPAIAADAVLAAVIALFLRASGRGEREALAGAALVALGPSFAFISGYHGQIDAVAILPAVLGAIAWVRGGERRAAAAGLLIGLGAAVKTVPLFAVLGLLPSARRVREGVALAAVAVAVPALALAPWLLADTANTVDALTRNQGVPGFGGLSAFLQPELTRAWSANAALPEVNGAIEAATDVQNLLVAAAVLAVAALALRRRCPPLDGLVAIWLTVLAVNPNFAYQYVVWALPFLLLAGRLRTALLLQAVLLVPGVLLYTHADDGGWVYWVTVQAAWLTIVAVWVRELRAVLARRPAALATSRR